MNKERLKILRNALIKHAQNPGNLKFDLGAWAELPRRYRSAKPDKAVTDARLGKNFCGTTACAMGLAATLPAFKRLGLALRTGTLFGEYYGVELVYEARHGNGVTTTWNDGFAIAAQIFEIDTADALELFEPGSYSVAESLNPLAVADKITALLETA